MSKSVKLSANARERDEKKTLSRQVPAENSITALYRPWRATSFLEYPFTSTVERPEAVPPCTGPSYEFGVLAHFLCDSQLGDLRLSP